MEKENKMEKDKKEIEEILKNMDLVPVEYLDEYGNVREV